jgi:acetyl esterase/lipase
MRGQLTKTGLEPVSRRHALGLAAAAGGAFTAACSGGSGSGSGGSGSGGSGSGGSGSGGSGSGATSAAEPSGGSAGGSPSRAASDTIRARRIPYGQDRSQYGELYLPTTTTRRRGLIVVIHGGFWQAQYTAGLGASLGLDLARRGWAAWNLEYRRLGDGGGWPATFDDIAAGIDVLGTPALASAELDLTRVVAVGHSAGGQLAAWAAARSGLPVSAPGAVPKVRVHGLVSQAGVLDLARAADTSLGGTAAADLMGGRPAAVPDRYRLASPIARVPLGVPVRCVHSPDDGIIPLEQSQRYIDAATKAGDDASLVRTTGDHFALVTVGSPAWTATVGQLPALIG